MALPGHGPGNAALLIESALRLQPRFVLIGVYFGNDLYDGFALARANPAIGRFVPVQLLARAEERERAGAFTFGYKQIFRKPPAADRSHPSGSLRVFLASRSALWGLARALRARMQPPRDPILGRDFRAAEASLDAERRAWFSAVDAREGWRTILTGQYRARVMDLEDPRLAAGFEANIGALSEVRDAAIEHGVEVIAVLVPTKELVFAPRVPDPAEHVGLVDLLQRETTARQALMVRLATAGVAVLDLLAPLRAAGDVSPYFEDFDGHPNALGHERIARAVYDHLLAADPQR
jgi:hypothetical protein